MDTVNHIKLRVERGQAKTVLRALLSAIFFHRTLDSIEPETNDILETFIATAPNSAIERDIQAKVDEFARAFIDAGADSGEIAVVFLQRKNRKGWFAVTEALVPWEEHLITVYFITRATTNPLPPALMQLLTFCSEKKANVPPLVGSSDQNNLSHQILVSPPPPSELFAPSSPPLGPTRLTSPPPPPSTTTAVAVAHDLTAAPVARAYSHHTALGSAVDRTAASDPAGARRGSSPMTAISDAGTSAMGYLEQAKDGLLAVGAKAGAGVGWGGRFTNRGG